MVIKRSQKRKRKRGKKGLARPFFPQFPPTTFSSRFLPLRTLSRLPEIINSSGNRTLHDKKYLPSFDEKLSTPKKLLIYFRRKGRRSSQSMRNCGKRQHNLTFIHVFFFRIFRISGALAAFRDRSKASPMRFRAAMSV